MVSKKIKGSALIVVIMVMAVMTILGAAILNISISQTNQASYEDKRIQAHYLARSGAEATLRAWEDDTSDNKPSGVCNPVYLTSSNEFQPGGTPPLSMIGQFDVTVLEEAEDTVITSVGTVKNVKQTVTVTTPNPFKGETLDWYDNSGQARVDGKDGEHGVVVLVNPKMLKLEKLSPTYRADTIMFDTQIWNFKKQLTLNAGMLIFVNKTENKIDWSHGGNLVLQVSLLVGVTRTDQPDKTEKWGRIEYNSQWYYFRNNTTVFNDANIESLDKIIATDPNYPSSYYSIKWS